MFFCISENLKYEEIKIVIMPSSFLRHCGHFLGTEAHKFAKRENKKEPTKRHEAQQSNPKPSKLWVWVHERGQKNG